MYRKKEHQMMEEHYKFIVNHLIDFLIYLHINPYFYKMYFI